MRGVFVCPKSVEEKLEIITSLLRQEQSITQLSHHYKINDKRIQSWKIKYEQYGIDGLKECRTWKQYSVELKTTSEEMSRMKQARKIAGEEGGEIVNYTIAHEKGYQAVVEGFGISYQ